MSKQVFVLKTSLTGGLDVEKTGILLNSYPHIVEWSVDLEDCDKVLRVECYGLYETDIIEMLKQIEVEAERLL